MNSTWLYAIDEECQTPLSRAVQSNHMALTELLLRQEAEDSSANLEGSTLLHKAASLGLDDAVKRLLEEGDDPNELDKYGETPLHRAVRHGHHGVTQILIEFGANINKTNVFGLSPLHWVALNGRSTMAEILLEAGADPSLADEYLDGLTPIALAAIMNYEDLANLMASYHRKA